MNQRFLSVWLDNWPIQRWVVQQPELKRQAVVLYAQHGSRGQRVSAASPAAFRCGVRLDMPLSEARAIISHNCTPGTITPREVTLAPAPPESPPTHAANDSGDPQTITIAAAPASGQYFFLLPHDPATDRRELEQLALTCESFSPHVALEPAATPQCILLETSSVAHLFGGEPGLLRAVQRHFADRGYWVRLGLASTPAGSMAAARLIAAEPKPAIIDAAPGTIAPPLLPLPVTGLRLNSATVQTLHALGIQQIGQLVSLSRNDLKSRFGDEINQRLDQLSGATPELLTWLRPPAEFYAQQFLDFPTTDSETIEFILSRLVDDLCRQMRNQRRGGLGWEIRLYSPHAPSRRIAVQLFQPTATPRHVLPLVRMQLEQHGLGAVPGHSMSPAGRRRRRIATRQDFSDQAFCVHHLSVTVSNSVVLVDRQRLLFDENPRLDRQQLVYLINRLSARLGCAQVVRARLVADAQPEQAFVFEPLVGEQAISDLSTQQSDRAAATKKTRRHAARSHNGDREGTSFDTTHRIRQSLPLQRPLRLFDPIELRVEAEPIPVAVHLPDSASTSSPRRRHRRISITRAWGPERIETGWWRAPTLRRDYWRVELSDGRWLWLFRDLRSQHWFWQGEF